MKTIACPKKVKFGDLKIKSGSDFSCEICEKTVHNTDFITEEEVENLIREKPTVCLSINLKNPMFERIE